MFLLFPTGRLRSRRRRPAAWLSRRLLWRNNRQDPIPPGPLRLIKGKYSEVLWSGCEQHSGHSAACRRAGVITRPPRDAAVAAEVS
jgi:hypothetical protein